MELDIESFAEDFDPSFKVFHELMAKKVGQVLLVSTPYDAWIMEEDCRLSERIINEYKGLNLSNPPRFTWVSTAEDALAALDKKNFDLVITMLHLAESPHRPKCPRNRRHCRAPERSGSSCPSGRQAGGTSSWRRPRRA